METLREEEAYKYSYQGSFLKEGCRAGEEDDVVGRATNTPIILFIYNYWNADSTQNVDSTWYKKNFQELHLKTSSTSLHGSTW